MRPRSERPLQVNSVFRSQVVIGWISTSLPKGLDSPAGGLDNGLSSPVSCRPFSEQTADLPVPGNFPGNFREYSHCSKSPLIFKTRNLQGRCCGRGWISRGSKPVKALEKNQSVRPGGGKAGLESFSERSRPERKADGARRQARRLPRGGLEALGLAGRPVEESVGLQNQCHSCCCSPVVVGCVCRTREKERYRYKYGRERA